MWMMRIATVVIGASVMLNGCRKQARVAALPPMPPAAVSVLDQADAAFEASDYGEAVRRYDAFLQSTPAAENRDQALFRLAMSQALLGGPTPDWGRVASTLQQLVDEFPNSPLRPQASLILGLTHQVTTLSADSERQEQRVRQLTTELDRLKQIDAERRRRPQ